MINLKNPVFLSPDFIKNLDVFPDIEEKWAVMIFPLICAKTRPIRIIATKSPRIIKVSIDNYIKTGDFLQELGIVFMRNNLKTIYSTGICFCDRKTPCHPYEGYIDSSVLSISTDQLKSELLAIPSIVNVEITNVNLENK